MSQNSRAVRHRPDRKDDRGGTLLLTVLVLFAVLGMIAAVSVPVIANITSVSHNRSVSDARRVGEEVVNELFARLRDQRTTAATLPTVGAVTPGANPVAGSWVEWNSTHSDFVACASTADTCFYYSYKFDATSAGATPRSMVMEVTVRNGCSQPDTCTYRRYQQTVTRRLLTDYLMIADADTGLYIEGQPATPVATTSSQAIAGAYWRNISGTNWAMSNVSLESSEELWGTGADVTSAVQAAAGTGLAAPKGAIRVMTQLSLSDVGTYQIRAADPDESGRLRWSLRTAAPNFDVPHDQTLALSSGSYSATDSVVTTSPNSRLVIDLIVLNNNANKSKTGSAIQLQIKPPSGSSWIDVADANAIAMHATFDTANRSGTWFYDGPIHINGTTWQACNRLDLFDNGEASTSALVTAGKASGCTAPSSRSLDRNGATAATSFATTAPKIVLPTTFTEQETVAGTTGTTVNYGADIRLSGSTFVATNLSTGIAAAAQSVPTNSVLWVKGNAELSGTADNVTILVDGDATITGDLVGNNLGVVVKGNLKVRASLYKRTIQASLLAVGTAGLETPTPGAWAIGLPQLQLFGSVAASKPFQNSDGDGGVVPQFKLPTPPWTPPYFPQAANAKWEQTSLTELPVTTGLTGAP